MEVRLTADNFEREVLNSKLPVLVDFWASWCSPCKMIAPYVKEVAKEYHGKVKVCKLNVDEAPEVASKYTIMSIPTLMIFKEGKIMGKKVGALGKESLEKFVSENIIISKLL